MKVAWSADPEKKSVPKKIYTGMAAFVSNAYSLEISYIRPKPVIAPKARPTTLRSNPAFSGMERSPKWPTSRRGPTGSTERTNKQDMKN